MFDWQHPLVAQAGSPSPSQAEDPASTADTTAQPGDQPAGAQGAASSSPLANPLFFLLFLMVMMYIFVFLGRGKKQKKFDEMLRNLKKSDRIVTIGGIVGTVVSTRDDEVVVKVDESSNIKMTFVRKAIQRVLHDDQPAPKS